ncbi:MAG: hypothetical protein EPN19_02425 [Betaproteobacteria bacterium]|nr:MAG: hypothetical protein EPN19_02425 [Betaproteobacteria bacterium]
MAQSTHQPETTPTLVTHPLRKEIVYTTTGRLGFLQSETAHTVTIQLAPDRTLTLPKEEIDCRFKLI